MPNNDATLITHRECNEYGISLGKPHSIGDGFRYHCGPPVIWFSSPCSFLSPCQHEFLDMCIPIQVETIDVGAMVVCVKEKEGGTRIADLQADGFYVMAFIH